MADRLYSVGLDVGTTTTQLILSRLQVEDRGGGFAVPRMEITGREILYESPVRFTPLKEAELVDADALRDWVRAEYKTAGIQPEQVDTGAVIITGESSRKENARAVLDTLSSLAGDFVVATAGPELESVLAAKGAGATAYSEKTGKRVLHMDIGGGTSNLALIENGRILAVGCLNVGGRLIRLEEGRITYLSPVLTPLTTLRPGDRPEGEVLEAVIRILVHGLEMAAGLRPVSPLYAALLTREVTAQWEPPKEAVISFSGGVADCMEGSLPPFAYGDIGVLLGQAIRRSRLCEGAYRIARHTLRATVIGAGCHSTQLSGSTVFCRNIPLPLRDIPVIALNSGQQNTPEAICRGLARHKGERVVLALPGYSAPNYAQVRRLAQSLARTGEKELLVALETDMAKALGHCLATLLPPSAGVLCIDGLSLSEGSYLDVGEPIGPALPVVIKTLILSK